MIYIQTVEQEEYYLRTITESHRWWEMALGEDGNGLVRALLKE